MRKTEYKIEAFVCQRKNMERDGFLALFDERKPEGYNGQIKIWTKELTRSSHVVDISPYRESVLPWFTESLAQI